MYITKKDKRESRQSMKGTVKEGMGNKGIDGEEIVRWRSWGVQRRSFRWRWDCEGLDQPVQLEYTYNIQSIWMKTN